MKGKQIVKKISVCSLSAFMAMSTMNFVIPMNVAASEINISDYTTIGGVASFKTEGNIVEITYTTGEIAKITFLENNIFRFNMETDSSKEFLDVPDANSKDHTATIVQQMDDSDEYSHPDAVVTDGDTIVVSTKDGTTQLLIDKATSKMKLMNGDQVVWEETKPLMYKTGSTIQTLKENTDEYFYGGGTQNGRFSHKGETLDISNTNNWVNNGVASPNPFYWSTNGYGVMRNTWKPGTYDFGDTATGEVQTLHKETRFDAYYFVDNQPTDILKDYYKVTGAPALLPEYAFYLGHLNCYNRDAWSASENGKWLLEDGKRYNEVNREGALNAGETLETLNGNNDNDYKFSARAVIDGHEDLDMPLGWFLPNDGYGCGYGRTGNLTNNIKNLGNFTEYANSKGVETGLWTQSDLTPVDGVHPDLQRDFEREVVEGGIRSLKTDVAWVGEGYSFGLNGIKFASDTIVNKTNERPNIVTLDGWAGTQRYGGIWTGDQTGGNWEYIRFHIPTYIGQSLSGNPNIGSDMDGIFGGSPVVQTRDFQWKAFTPLMLDMDGWGDYPKKPYAFGEDNTSINRMYLKMKAEMMPYIYTMAHEATGLNGTSGKPMIRAMMLDYPDSYSASTATQYQYMWGDNLLVAPIYQNTKSDENGNDIRNNIYLPDEDQVWIDYFTGEQYQGGRVLNNFDAPIWKLPLFVKNGAIIPMYEEHNNAQAKTAANDKGLDKTKRVIEFYPSGSTEFNLYEDDGTYAENNKDNTEINYGESTNTHITSVVEGDKATLTIGATSGSYKGYDADRTTTMVVNVSKKPTSLTATIGANDVTLKEVKSQDEFDKAEGNVYFYNVKPDLNKYATKDSDFAKTEITTTPKLYVKYAQADVSKNETKLVVEGFANDGVVIKEEKDNLAVPTGLTFDNDATTFTDATVSWTGTEGAISYEVSVDGIANTAGEETTFTKHELNPDTEYSFAVRAVYEDGYSKWSEPITGKTKLDPYLDVIPEFTISSQDASSSLSALKDRDLAGAFYSKFDNNNPEVAKRVKTFDFDFGAVYQMDKFEIYPTPGNDVFTQHQPSDYSILGSYDGINYFPVVEHEINEDKTDSVKTVDLKKTKMRYMRFVVHEPYETWIALAELMPYKVKGTESRPTSDYNNDNKVDSNDITFLTNYNGLKSTDADWGYITGSGADVNNNGVVDAYDISFAGLAVGNFKGERTNASGRMSLTPSKKEIKAGEEFTVAVEGIGMKNVNAFGVSLPMNSDQFEYKGVEVGAAAYDMTSFVTNRVHTDKTTTLYANFTNIGEQELISGNKQLVVLKFKAKEDMTWDVKPNYAMLVGTNLNVVDGFAASDEMPSMDDDEIGMPLSNIIVKGQDESVLQEGMGVDKLIDGYIGEDSVRFEFQWGDESIDARLPYELTYTFKEPMAIKALNVYLRNDGGVLNGGAMKDFELYAADENGNKGELIGTYSANQETTVGGVFNVDLGNTEYRGLILKALTSQSGLPYKLNIDETEFVIDVPVESIDVDVNKYKEIPLGSMVEFEANVMPENASNKYYTVESADESIVRVDRFVSGDDISFQLQGMKEGATTITVASVKDPNVKKVLIVRVNEAKVNTYYLQELIDEAGSLEVSIYTTEAQKELLDGVNKARMLAATSTDQAEVDKACIELRKLIAKVSNSLNLSDEAHIIKGVKAISETSNYMGYDAGYAVDGNVDSAWYSQPYDDEISLPQSMVVQLGDEVTRIRQIDYLGVQDAYDGQITKYKVEVSTTGTEDDDFTEVITGNFAHDGSNLLNPGAYKHIVFPEVDAKYVRFTALESLSSENKYATAAELRFYQAQEVEVSGEPTLNGTFLEDPETKVNYVVLPENASMHFHLFLDGNVLNGQLVEGIEWTSSDEGVASVENGLVKPHRKGVATITATVKLRGRALPVSQSFEVRVNGIDRSGLLSQIEVTEQLTDKANAVKTTALKDYFFEALKEAKDLYASDNVFEDEIASAMTKLSNATQYLSKDDSFVLLQKTTDHASLLNKDFYDKDEEAFAAFDAALANANAVLADPIANIDDVISTLDALLDAEKALDEIELAALQAAIEKYEALDLSVYAADANLDTFKTELANAKELMKKPETQQNVLDQIEALNAAAKALNVKASAEAVEEIKAIKAELDKVDLSKYSDDTRATISDYIEKVNAAVANAELTKADAEAIINVWPAMSSVIANPDGNSGNQGGNTPGGDSNQGGNNSQDGLDDNQGGSSVVPGTPGLPSDTGVNVPTGGTPLGETSQQASKDNAAGSMLALALAAGSLVLFKRKEDEKEESITE